MKKHTIDFVKRGMLAAAGGPVILAVIYLILHSGGTVQSLDPGRVAVEILTASLLAFIASGCSVVYNIEKLPLMHATFIHALALYLDYILIYLLNGWIGTAQKQILIFTGIFFLCYAIVWSIIFASVKVHVKRLNEMLQQ